MYPAVASVQAPACVDHQIATALEQLFPTADRRTRVAVTYGILRTRYDGVQAIPVPVVASPLYRAMAPVFGIPVSEQLQSIDLLAFYGAVLYGYADAVAAGAPPLQCGQARGAGDLRACAGGSEADDSNDDADVSDDDGSYAPTSRAYHHPSFNGDYIATYTDGVLRVGVEFTRALLCSGDSRFSLLLAMVREEIHACPRQDVQRAERRGALAPAAAASSVLEMLEDVVPPTRLGKIRPRGSSDDDDDDDEDKDAGTCLGGDGDAAVAMVTTTTPPPTTGASETSDVGVVHSTRHPRGTLSYAARSRARLVDDIVEAARVAAEDVILQLERSIWRPIALSCSRAAHCGGTRPLPLRIPAQWSYPPRPAQQFLRPSLLSPPLELAAALRETFDCLMFSRGYHYPLHFGVHHAARTRTHLLQTGPHRSGLSGGDVIAFAMSVVRRAAREDSTYSEHDVTADAFSQLCLDARAPPL